MSLSIFLQSIKDHLADPYPELAESLYPPASRADIQEAERIMQMDFPDELRELYLIHDGQNNRAKLFFGLTFLPLKEVVATWQQWSDAAKEANFHDDVHVVSAFPSHIKEKYANPKYIPFSADERGNHIGIDLDPGPDGEKGQIINFGSDEEARYVIAGSLSKFLAFILHHIENDNYKLEEINFQYGRRLVLKHPWNMYFLNTLHQLSLPYDKPFEISFTPPAEDFHPWFESLSQTWKEEIRRYTNAHDGFEQLRHITSLKLIDKAISDLSPIKAFPNLRELIMMDTQVQNIEPLRSLAHLKILFLSNNKIFDASPLITLTKLEKLNLTGADVNSTHFLGQLTQIKDLNISHTAIDSLQDFRSLYNLLRLNLSFNRLSDYSDLAKFKKLQFLDISHTNILDLNFLESLHWMKELNIADAPIKDFDLLISLPHLEELTVNFRQFSLIKDLVIRPVQFHIEGDMTEEQAEIYQNYMQLAVSDGY